MSGTPPHPSPTATAWRASRRSAKASPATRRLAAVLAASTGMATVAASAQLISGGASAADHSPRHLQSVPTADAVHAESVSAPVLVSAADMAASGADPSNGTVVNADRVATTPAAPTTAAAPAAPAAPAAAPAATSSSDTSSSDGSGQDLGTFLVTCYDIHGQTATGDQAGPQSVAVDPSVIPLGTRIYIQGVGYRTADDTGSAVQGHHIDIWESTDAECTQFGRQYLDVRRAS